MNYSQTLDYLYKALPMFHRIGAAAYKANLDNTIAICDLLKNPERQLTCIHVAGTNGKGSVSHMLAAILQAAGYKTGLYTSPHLKDFRERIKVNGKMINRKYVSDFVTTYKKDFDIIQPSFFEMTVGLAFKYFIDRKIDIAVIETGLGGRLDSTNVITPVLSIITNIGWDHMNLLGDTIEKIAVEKAGIIKKGVPVVIGESQPATKKIFSEKAALLDALLYFASERIKTSPSKKFKADNEFLVINAKRKGKIIYKDIRLDLTGLYQLKNAATVLQAIELLKADYEITEQHVKTGLSAVKSSTGLAGRWQMLNKKPLTIADTGHNPDGIKEVLRMIKKTPHKHLHFILGMVEDKAIEKILVLLPRKATYYFCKADIPRGMNADKLADYAGKFKLRGNAYQSVKHAMNAAKKSATLKDLIFVGGSTFTVAEVI